MPYDKVLDVLSDASNSVTILMNKKLQGAPVFIKQIVKSEDNGQGANDKAPVKKNKPDLYQNNNIVNVIRVYSIWEIFLEYQRGKKNSVFVVISGDFLQKGYQNGEWENFEFEGFYTTVQEAESEISSHMQ